MKTSTMLLTILFIAIGCMAGFIYYIVKMDLSGRGINSGIGYLVFIITVICVVFLFNSYDNVKKRKDGQG